MALTLLLSVLALATVAVQAVDPPGPVDPTVQTLQLDHDGKTCFYATFATQFAIQYNNTESHKTVTGYLNVVNGTINEKESTCDNKTANIVVNWPSASHVNQTVTLNFINDNGTNYLHTLELTFDSEDEHLFPNYSNPKMDDMKELKNQTLFKVGDGQSYACASVYGKEGDFQVTFTKVQLDAFRNSKTGDKTFTNVQTCENAPLISDLVPIAVGIALLALVVIVLIAYFIGRRRSRRLAYQSV